jgi:hypothetical protein
MPAPLSIDMGGPLSYTRQQIRWRLGRDFIHDTHLGTNQASLGAGIGSVYFIDNFLADASYSGEVKYTRSWARYNGETFRCATFNFASGAFVALQPILSSGITPGVIWELHELISPEDKDHAITFALERSWRRQEVAFNTVAGLTHYSAGFDFGEVYDWWVYSDPSGSADRSKRIFRAQRPEIRLTATGREIRIGEGGLEGSQQLVLDAQVRLFVTGEGDTGQVNFPSRHYEQMVLYGAESQCWEMLSKRGPAEDRRGALRNAQRAAAAYSRLSGRFTPQRDYAPRFRNQVMLSSNDSL